MANSVPFQAILVAERERMMESVVALAERDQGGQQVVLGRGIVRIHVVAEPVRQRVDEPG